MQKNILAALLLLSPVYLFGDDLKDFLSDARKDLESFKGEAYKELAEFRKQALNDLQEWISQPWEPGKMENPIPNPIKDKPIPPLIIPKDEPAPKPKDEPIPSPVTVPTTPRPEPKPKPVIPVTPVPVKPTDNFHFLFYGTPYEVAGGRDVAFNLGNSNKTPDELLKSYLSNVDIDAVGDVFSSLMDSAEQNELSEWAYYKLIETFCKELMPGKINEQQLLTGLLMILSGYDIKFAEDGNRLYIAVGCPYLVLDTSYTFIDGKRYYFFDTNEDFSFRILPETFGKNKLLSVQPSGKEKFASSPGKVHKIVVCNHSPHCYNNACKNPDLTFDITGNINRMNFYSDCKPFIYENIQYKWIGYALTELSDEMKRQIYPELKKAIAGMNEVEAANYLMNVVEACDYAYDRDVWGVEDRAFFPEETLHYPLRDCEDGAILFSRLVRDLLGLPTALIYYPGHLAAAVCFKNRPQGAYINYDSKQYTVCDPTIYYAGIGVQMSIVDASKAVLIPIND